MFPHHAPPQHHHHQQQQQQHQAQQQQRQQGVPLPQAHGQAQFGMSQPQQAHHGQQQPHQPQPQASAAPRYARQVVGGQPGGGGAQRGAGAGSSHPGGYGQPVPAEELLSRPSADVTSYYTPFLPSAPYASTSGSYTSSVLGLGGLGVGLSEEDAVPGARDGNRGNKLKKGARWVRKGKAVAWGMGVGQREIEDCLRARLRLTLNHHLPAHLKPKDESPARSPSPPLLPHLRSPSPPPPLSSSSLSYLLSPPRSYTEIVCSPAMRHTFASGHLEDALGRTAGELIEGETGLLKALGRFFEECRERGVGRMDEDDVEDQDHEMAVDAEEPPVAAEPVRQQPDEPKQEPVPIPPADAPSVPGSEGAAAVASASDVQTAGQVNGDAPVEPTPITNGTATTANGEPSSSVPATEANTIPVSPATDSEPVSASVPQPKTEPEAENAPLPPAPQEEPPAPVAVPAAPPLSPGTLATISGTPLSALERMFITPEGVPALGPVEEIRVKLGLMAPPPVPVLNIEMQKEHLYRGMDALGELLADSREYVERLEEVRERLAGVGRGRKRVWREVRERVIENGELGEED